MIITEIIKKILFRRKHLICIGDSHIQVFEYIKKYKLIPNAEIEIKIVGGATAQGMVNPNSKTQALNIFKNYLKNKRKSSTILIQLGEVDCGFVIWYRSQKYNISIEEQLNISLNNYFKFLKYLKNIGFKTIIILGAILPTIKDNVKELGEVANLRKEVKASQKERTDLTLKYNRLLKEFSVKNDFKYIEITDYIINKETGLVDDQYANQDKRDHHLSNEKTAPFWIKELKQLGIL